MSKLVDKHASDSDSDPDFTKMIRKGNPFSSSPAAGILRAQPVTGSTAKVGKVFTAISSKRFPFPGVDDLQYDSDDLQKPRKQSPSVVTKPPRASDGAKKSRASDDFDPYEGDSDCVVVEKPLKQKISVAAKVLHASDAFDCGTGGLKYDSESDGFVKNKPRKQRSSVVTKPPRASDGMKKSLLGAAADGSDGDGGGSDDDSSIDSEPAPMVVKRKKKVPRSIDDILADFKYPLPLGRSPLPSIKEFNPPMCSCRFMGFQIRKEAKTTGPKRVVEVKCGEKMAKRFFEQLPAIDGGKLRSYKCQGWTIAGFKPNGDPLFKRKEGFSDGSTCFSLAIDEVTRRDKADRILEVRLSAEAEAYFRTPEARKGKW
jgi:hypothetical protein